MKNTDLNPSVSLDHSKLFGYSQLLKAGSSTSNQSKLATDLHSKIGNDENIGDANIKVPTAMWSKIGEGEDGGANAL